MNSHFSNHPKISENIRSIDESLNQILKGVGELKSACIKMQSYEKSAKLRSIQKRLEECQADFSAFKDLS